MHAQNSMNEKRARIFFIFEKTSNGSPEKYAFLELWQCSVPGAIYCFMLVYAYTNVTFSSFAEVFTVYKIWVQAYTLNSEGYPSEPISCGTDVASPSEPLMINASCFGQGSIYVEWMPPKSFYESIDMYQVTASAWNNSFPQQISIPPVETQPPYTAMHVRIYYT